MVSKKALQKYKILSFWKKYGLEATTEAFGIKRRTLFYWNKLLKLSNGKVESLNDKSKRPKKLRARLWPKEVINEIKRLREAYPNISKEKIYPFLLSFCNGNRIDCPSVSTIGRIIADAPDKMRFAPTRINAKGKVVIRKKTVKTYKPKSFIAKYPGHCIALDTIEKIVEGYRRYIITFIDIYSRYSFSWATNSHTSETAKQFFLMVKTIFPFKIKYVLTDGGAEFKKTFSYELAKDHKIHWHTYPRTPKMNAHCERFNRTIQEEFIDYYRHQLVDDLESFNSKMIDYLIWYNSKRPHWGLNLKSPIEFISDNNFQCNLGWTDTRP